MMVIQSKVTVAALFIACMSCLPPQPAAVAVIPNSGKPGAYTEKQFRQELLEYNRKTMSGTYLKVGKRDPKWDDLAVELLDAQASVFTNHNTHNTDAVQITADLKRRREIVALLQDVGCDDPLVLYVSMHQMMPTDEGYVQAARRAYQGLIDSRYPSIRKQAAAAWLYRQLDDDDDADEAAAVLESIKRACHEVFTGEDLSADQQRILFHIMVPALEDLPRPVWKAIVQDANESDSPNRWLIDMNDGAYHLVAAWDARGGGWASTVTKEGWMGFREHLLEAEVSLQRAWKEQPDLPHAAAKMITVSLGLGKGQQQEQLWFVRATTAQLDYFPAYTRYGTTLRPRWGGSHEQLYAFGTECLETGRFDTQIPTVFYEVMRSIHQDTDDYDYWARPGIYEQFVKYFEGRKHETNPDGSEQWWDSMKAAVAWRAKRYDQAVLWLDRLGDEVDPKAFEKVKADPPIAMSEARARTGPAGPQIDRADKLLLAGRARAAADVLDGVVSDLAEGDPAEAFLKKYATVTRWKHADRTGVWVELTGRPDLSGWRVYSGDWSVDDRGRILGQSSYLGMELECGYNFGYRMEIKGAFTLLESPTPQQLNAGILLAFYKLHFKYHRDVFLYPALQSVITSRQYLYSKQEYPAEVRETNTFHLQTWDKHMRLTVNGQVVFENRMMTRDLPRKVYPFAIGGGYWKIQEGSQVRFDELKARRLDRRPAWATDQDQHDTKEPGTP